MTKKRFSKLAFGVLSLIQLLIFTSFYITVYLPSVRIIEPPLWIVDGAYYLTSAVEYCLPLLSAVAALCLAGASVKKGIILSGIFSLPRLFYLIPYYYLYEIAYGNNSFESIGLSLLISLGLALLLSLHAVVLYLTAYLVTSRAIRHELIGELPPLKQKNLDEDCKKALDTGVKNAFEEQLKRGGIIDLSVPVLVGIFAAAFIDFIYNLIEELIGAIGYLTEFAGTYTPDEILLMGASFIAILIKLLIAYFAALPIKALATKTVD